MKDTDTFGSNIKNLLAQDFFMENAEFSDKKITEAIENIKDKTNDIHDETVIDLIGDSFLRSSIQQFKDSND